MNKEPRRLNSYEITDTSNFSDYLRALRRLPVPERALEEIEVELTEPPTHSDFISLRETLAENVEYALLSVDGIWKLTKGQTDIVGTLKLQDLKPGDCYFHTHPYIENEGPFDMSLPSARDVVQIMQLPSGVINGIISGAGILIYTSSGARLETAGDINNAREWYRRRLYAYDYLSDAYHAELLKAHLDDNNLELYSYRWGEETEAFLNWYLSGNYYVQSEFTVTKHQYSNGHRFEPHPVRPSLATNRPRIPKNNSDH